MRSCYMVARFEVQIHLVAAVRLASSRRERAEITFFGPTASGRPRWRNFGVGEGREHRQLVQRHLTLRTTVTAGALETRFGLHAAPLEKWARTAAGYCTVRRGCATIAKIGRVMPQRRAVRLRLVLH